MDCVNGPTSPGSTTVGDGRPLHEVARSQASAPQPILNGEVEAVYRAAIDRMDANEQCVLAARFATGEGIAKNLALSALLYKQAAQQGLPQAQCELGLCFGYGRGVAKDQSKAVSWFIRAVDQGHAQAQYNLGDLLSPIGVK